MSDKLSRRDFLVASATLAAGPALSRLASAVPSPAPGIILGSGSHKFECIHDWLVPPTNMKFGDTHGLTQDSKGRIYLSHTVHHDSMSRNAVCVYDEKGKFLTSWGAEYDGGAHGLDIHREGKKEFIYHCDIQRNLVVKTDLSGKVLWERGVPMESDKYPKGEGYKPTNVAFGPGKQVFVADGYGSNWVHEYDTDGNYKKTWGGYGNGKGQLAQPHGIWLDTRYKEPRLAVADRANRRIQYFDLDGHHIEFVSAGMRLPCHFSIRKGEMLVPDLDSVITILDEKNTVVVQLGDGAPSSLRDHPRSEFIPGKFIHPHDAIFLRNGDILVAEWVPIGRVTLLRHVK